MILKRQNVSYRSGKRPANGGTAWRNAGISTQTGSVACWPGDAAATRLFRYRAGKPDTTAYLDAQSTCSGKPGRGGN